MSRPARDSDDPTQFRELFPVSGVDTGLADLAFSRRPCTCWRSFQDSSASVVVDGNRFRRSFTADLNYRPELRLPRVRGQRQPRHHVHRHRHFATSANYVTITGNVFRLRPTASSVGDYGSSHVTVRDNTTVPLL